MTIVDRNAFYRKKKTIIARTESFIDIIVNTLNTYVKSFPSIDNLPMFYQELIDIKIDRNKLKKALGAADWARKTCQLIQTKQLRSLKKSKNINFLQEKQQEIYGRISSIIKQIKKELAKTTGNTFTDVLEGVEKRNQFVSKHDAYAYTRELLKVPASLISDLEVKDREVIEGYDTSP